MSKSLANEVYTENIRVHVIAPGAVFTDMVRIARPDLTEEGMILPEDIAEVVAFFIEHRSNAVVDEIQVHRAGKAPFA
jgi:NADP-dependent 3-hydroxy acid dehydrogenase YdfG